MKRYIIAHAKQKQALEWSIGAHTDVIIEHLIKIICLPKHSAKSHWMSEVANQLNRVQRLKSSGRYPSKEQLFSWTYETALDDIRDASALSTIISNIEFDYNVTITISAEELSKRLDHICAAYFDWLATKLSENGVAKNQDIYATLNELI